jgi:hypothetical protein
MCSFVLFNTVRKLILFLLFPPPPPPFRSSFSFFFRPNRLSLACITVSHVKDWGWPTYVFLISVVINVVYYGLMFGFAIYLLVGLATHKHLKVRVR